MIKKTIDKIQIVFLTNKIGDAFMEVLTKTELLKKHCRSTNKWGLCVSLSPEEEYCPYYEYLKTLRCFDIQDNNEIVSDKFAFLFFDTKEEMEEKTKKAIRKNRGSVMKMFLVSCSNLGEIIP